MTKIIYALIGMACLLIGNMLMARYAESIQKNTKHKVLRLITSTFTILPMSIVFTLGAIIAFGLFLGLVEYI